LKNGSHISDRVGEMFKGLKRAVYIVLVYAVYIVLVYAVYNSDCSLKFDEI